MKDHDDILIFNEDVAREGGYVYTLPQHRMRHEVGRRISGIVNEIVDLKGKRVIDIGCGDGTFTIDYGIFDPALVLGVDPAEKAIECAKKRQVHDQRFRFEVGSANDLEQYYNKYDVAIIRGVLHHLKDPAGAAAEIIKTAPTTIVIEANGLSPIVNLIPICSRYAREHNEKVYLPSTVISWFRNAGAKINNCQYRSFVPTFFPYCIGRTCQIFEPLIESLPLIKSLACAYHIFRADRISK